MTPTRQGSDPWQACGKSPAARLRNALSCHIQNQRTEERESEELQVAKWELVSAVLEGTLDKIKLAKVKR